MATAYQPYTVLRRSDGANIGSVEAQDHKEAVYRLVGGDYGRDDYVARCGSDRPMAIDDLTSYRYAGRYGFVMIGARDHEDALREAARSVEGTPQAERLQVWDYESLNYVDL